MSKRKLDELQFQLGTIELNDNEINYNGALSDVGDHRYILENKDPLVIFHLQYARRHLDIAKMHNLKSSVLDEEVIGGGHFYISSTSNKSKLHSFSSKYGAVPEIVLARFSDLLVPELRERGYEISEGVVSTDDWINPYWMVFEI